jgi:hypothetical protein
LIRSLALAANGAWLVACSWPEHSFRDRDASVVTPVEDTADLPIPTPCPPESERQQPCDELRHFPGTWDVDGEGREFCRIGDMGKLATPMRRWSFATAAKVTPAGAMMPEQIVVRAGLSSYGVHVFVQVLDDRNVIIDRVDPLKGDAVEIFLRGTHDRTLTGALDVDQAHHLVFTPPAAGAEGVGFRYLNNKPVGSVPDGDWHSRRVRDGWEVELHYPWKSLDDNQSAPGMTLGFDIAINLRDDPSREAERAVMHLEPTETGCKDPSCDDRTWCLAKAYVP